MRSSRANNFWLKKTVYLFVQDVKDNESVNSIKDRKTKFTDKEYFVESGEKSRFSKR